jgi:GNAT superfamily N-acetyltransferase
VDGGTARPDRRRGGRAGDDPRLGQDGSEPAGPGQPYRYRSFLVDPAHQGRGVGRALGEQVLETARADGFHGIQFNAVVEVNHPAVRLWKSLGFQIIGTVPEAFDHPDEGLVGLHVMYQRLT